MKLTSPNNIPEFATKIIRDYKNLNKTPFLNDLYKQLYTINNNDQNVDVNVLFSRFHKIFFEIVDKHIPLRTCRRKELRRQLNPWSTNAILKSINTKNKLYFIKLKYRTIENDNKYKKYRNKLNHIIKKAKADYYKMKLESYGNKI